MCHRTTGYPLEPAHDAIQSYMMHAIFLAYGAEAMVPTELAYGTPRIQAYDDEQETLPNSPPTFLMRHETRSSLSPPSINRTYDATMTVKSTADPSTSAT